MNRQEAKKLNEFLGELSPAFVDKLVGVGLLASHVLANYRAGHIKAFADGKDVRLNGEKCTRLAFNANPDSYSIHDLEIDWEKAMKHGAWGEDFMFTDGEEWFGPYKLMGYYPGSGCNFSDEVVFWIDCKPVEGFEVPKEWLKDE